MTQKYNSVSSNIIAELKQIVTGKNIIVDEEKLLPYSHDEVTDIRYHHLPEVVVFPENREQVAEVIKLANRALIPVTPRGAGSGLSAGAAPLYGGIVLSLEKMNKIIEVNSEYMYMIVQAGVMTEDVQKTANEVGLLYAGDPSSGDSCFIGGNIATNAGGNKAVKYGTTRAQVYSIEVVTPTGEITEFGGLLNKSTSGYCLEQLLIGSEGTLGIITQATLKLVPLSSHKMDFLAIYSDIDAAISSVYKLIKAGVHPTSLEYMDNISIKACGRYLNEALPYQDDGGNYLIITVETDTEAELDAKAEQIDTLCSKNGAIAILVPESKKIWAARKCVEDANRSESLIHSSEDLVVPIKDMPYAMKEIFALCKKHNASGRAVCHAGDGNIHLTVMQGSITEEEWPVKLDEVLHDVYQFVYSIGGRMSGEHGIGSKRVKWMDEFTDPVQMEFMRAIKKAVDPNLILNPGTVFYMDKETANISMKK